MNLHKLNKFFLILFISFNDFGVTRSAKTVCKNLFDYFTMEINKNCYPDPDVDATPEMIAKNHGYLMHRIELISKDGYKLVLYHLIKNEEEEINNKPPVLLQHSILTYAKSFMLVGNKSLAFVLLNRGYDVWLSNFRVILYKEGHTKLSSWDPEYWNFSFHEMALNDLPVYIDYVRKNNRSPEKPIYTGHALGGTMIYAYASLNPKEAQENLKAIVNIASFAFAKNATSPFMTLGIMDLVGFLATTPPTKILYEQFVEPYTDKFIQTFCYTLRNEVICKLLMDYVFDKGHGQFQPEHFPTLIYGLKGLLPNMITDITYMFHTGRFGGRQRKNVKGAPKPVDYPLENIKVPVYILQSSNDAVCNVTDAQKTLEKMTNTKTELVVIDADSEIKFMHSDVFVGKHVEIMYEKYFKILDKLK